MSTGNRIKGIMAEGQKMERKILHFQEYCKLGPPMKTVKLTDCFFSVLFTSPVHQYRSFKVCKHNQVLLTAVQLRFVLETNLNKLNKTYFSKKNFYHINFYEIYEGN